MNAERKTAPGQSARQPTVVILVEAGREARIIPVIDDESQEHELSGLLERAQRMLEADTGEQRP